MSEILNIFRYIFPVLVVCIAVVLLCFYLQAKKKRATYDVTIPMTQDDNTPSVVHTISLEEEQHYDRFPPRYSDVDHPPPYALFDPKLTNVWPGGAPPAYEMYPITLPLAPHHWTTPTGSLYPTPLPSPVHTPTCTHGHLQRQRSLQTS
ncbi:hypothetical protein INR49_013786, partial [Caranx melampygus]